MNDTLALSANELRCLLDFCTPTIVVGFEDPWKALPADLVEFAGQQALGSLIERGLLFFKGNQAHYASDLSGFLDVLAGADECLAATWVAGEERGAFTLHRQSGRLLELSQLPSGDYKLRWFPSEVRILDLLMRPFRGQIVFATGASSFNLPMAVIDEAGKLARQSGARDAARYLQKANLAQADCSDLADTLANLNVHYSLASYSGRGDLSTLRAWFCQVWCGPDYMWLVEVEDEKAQIVRLRRITQMDFEARITVAAPRYDNQAKIKGDCG